MPAAEKQREYRKRKREQGFAEVRVWVPDTDRDIGMVRRYAKGLCAKAEKAKLR